MKGSFNDDLSHNPRLDWTLWFQNSVGGREFKMCLLLRKTHVYNESLAGKKTVNKNNTDLVNYNHPEFVTRKIIIKHKWQMGAGLYDWDLS